MDYEEIKYDKHYQYINEIIEIIKKNPENKKMSFFIETIMQTNKDEYILLCNALYKFITPQGGGMSKEEQAKEQQPESPTAKRLIEKLNQIISPIISPIKIPRKNKLLIDEQFRLKEDKYKYYLSFYIIDAINNITVSSSGS